MTPGLARQSILISYMDARVLNVYHMNISRLIWRHHLLMLLLMLLPTSIQASTTTSGSIILNSIFSSIGSDSSDSISRSSVSDGSMIESSSVGNAIKSSTITSGIESSSISSAIETSTISTRNSTSTFATDSAETVSAEYSMEQQTLTNPSQTFQSDITTLAPVVQENSTQSSQYPQITEVSATKVSEISSDITMTANINSLPTQMTSSYVETTSASSKSMTSLYNDSTRESVSSSYQTLSFESTNVYETTTASVGSVSRTSSFLDNTLANDATSIIRSSEISGATPGTGNVNLVTGSTVEPMPPIGTTDTSVSVDNINGADSTATAESINSSTGTNGITGIGITGSPNTRIADNTESTNTMTSTGSTSSIDGIDMSDSTGTAVSTPISDSTATVNTESALWNSVTVSIFSDGQTVPSLGSSESRDTQSPNSATVTPTTGFLSDSTAVSQADFTGSATVNQGQSVTGSSNLPGDYTMTTEAVSELITSGMSPIGIDNGMVTGSTGESQTGSTEILTGTETVTSGTTELITGSYFGGGEVNTSTVSFATDTTGKFSGISEVTDETGSRITEMYTGTFSSEATVSQVSENTASYETATGVTTNSDTFGTEISQSSISPSTDESNNTGTSGMDTGITIPYSDQASSSSDLTVSVIAVTDFTSADNETRLYTTTASIDSNFTSISRSGEASGSETFVDSTTPQMDISANDSTTIMVPQTGADFSLSYEYSTETATEYASNVSTVQPVLGDSTGTSSYDSNDTRSTVTYSDIRTTVSELFTDTVSTGSYPTENSTSYDFKSNMTTGEINTNEYATQPSVSFDTLSTSDSSYQTTDAMTDTYGSDATKDFTASAYNQTESTNGYDSYATNDYSTSSVSSELTATAEYSRTTIGSESNVTREYFQSTGISDTVNTAEYSWTTESSQPSATLYTSSAEMPNSSDSQWTSGAAISETTGSLTDATLISESVGPTISSLSDVTFISETTGPTGGTSSNATLATETTGSTGSFDTTMSDGTLEVSASSQSSEYQTEVSNAATNRPSDLTTMPSVTGTDYQTDYNITNNSTGYAGQVGSEPNLSGGEIAAIVICSTVGATALGGVAAWLFLKRNRKNSMYMVNNRPAAPPTQYEMMSY